MIEEITTWTPEERLAVIEAALGVAMFTGISTKKLGEVARKAYKVASADAEELSAKFKTRSESLLFIYSLIPEEERKALGKVV